MNSGLKYNFKCCNQRYPQSIHAMIRFTEAPVLCFHPAEVKSQSVLHSVYSVYYTQCRCRV